MDLRRGATADFSPVFQGRDDILAILIFVAERRLNGVFKRRSRDAGKLLELFPGVETPGYSQPSLRDKDSGSHLYPTTEAPRALQGFDILAILMHESFLNGLSEP